MGQGPLLARQVLRSLDLQLWLKGQPKMERKERKKMVALVNTEMKEFVLKFMGEFTVSLRRTEAPNSPVPC